MEYNNLNQVKAMGGLEIECTVEKLEPLRMPGITRNYCKGKDVDAIIELPESVYSLRQGDRVSIILTDDKEECIKGEFCGVSYVVSKSKIDDEIRAVLSIGGLLVILKTRNEELLKPINVIAKYYIGIRKAA